MKIKCPKCQSKFRRSEKYNKIILKFGHYYRTSDRKYVQRLFCKSCMLHFSIATLSLCYKQKKRHLNSKIARQLVAEVSLRESARILKINRKTVARKLIFMGALAHEKLNKLNQNRSLIKTMEFDDMETFEHTKCKPLSITLAVESKSRWIIGYEVSQMPCKGLLSKLSVKKYGYREDKRPEARVKLFKRIQDFVDKEAEIKSDSNPHYISDVRTYFPCSEYKRYKGRDACVVGQGELKKLGFDPLFSLNHTCATLRARVSRLIRRTWCTTKKPEMLSFHLALAVLHHNLNLKPPPTSTA